MSTLTFYGGAGEIGGNKILLESRKARIYLDFGQPFDFGAEYFYEWLTPRSANGLECYFEFDILPKIPRLYGRAQLQFTDLPYRKPDIDAVFISHHHADHAGHLPFLDESIPVHLGHGTKTIIDAYSTLFPSLLDIGEHEDLELFQSGDRIKVKDLVVRPVHVEHSTPGAYGFLVDAPGGTIAYSGDFRRHGPMRALTDEFIEEAAKAKPRALICEGTRMTPDPEKQFDESQVYEKVRGIVKRSKGLVFGEFSMCNIDRFRSFYHAARDAGRVMVIDTKYAYLLSCLRDKIDLPDPRTDPSLRVYFKLSKSREFCEADYGRNERGFLGNMITYREIRGSQKDFVMFTGFNKLMELVYIQPKRADYIFSSSEHFLEGEENREQRRVLDNWLSHFGIVLHKAHCSGHATRSDIEHAVRTIAPEILIPVHTENPEEFRKIHDNVVIPEQGGTIEI